MKPKENEKKDYSRKIAAGTSLLLVLALLTTSSLAFKDVDQFKENKFRSSGPEYNVVLVEDFEEVDDWLEGTRLDKKVHVKNGQESDPKDQKYEDAYVRLKFSEYMGIKEKSYEYSEDAYMIDSQGEFIRVDGSLSHDEAVSKLKALGVKIEDTEATDRVQKKMDGFENKEYYYVKSIENDPNGQWGKKIVTNVIDGEEESLVGEVDTFTAHLWTPESLQTNPFNKHVKWHLGEDVITLDEWKNNYNARPVKKWILDTTDTKDGWVYWGEPLVHITKDSSNYETSKLLESVESLVFPEGSLNYVLKVNMDAYSRLDLIKLIEGTSNDWNEEIAKVLLLEDELSVSIKALQDNIAKAKKLIKKYPNISVINTLKKEVENSERLLYNHLIDLTAEQVDSQNTILKKAIQAVSSDELAGKALKYIKAVDYSNEKVTTARNAGGYFEGAISLLEDSVQKWEKKFINSVEVTEEDINNAISDLQLKYSYVSKDKINFAGFDWNVLGVQEETVNGEKINVSMLILAEPLQNEIYSKIVLHQTQPASVSKGTKYIKANGGANLSLVKNFDDQVLKYAEDSKYIVDKYDLEIEDDTSIGYKSRISSISKENLAKNIYLKDFQENKLPTSANPYFEFEVDNTIQGLEASYWTKLMTKDKGYVFVTPEGSFEEHTGPVSDMRPIRPVVWIDADQVDRLARETMPRLD